MDGKGPEADQAAEALWERDLARAAARSADGGFTAPSEAPLETVFDGTTTPGTVATASAQTLTVTTAATQTAAGQSSETGQTGTSTPSTSGPSNALNPVATREVTTTTNNDGSTNSLVEESVTNSDGSVTKTGTTIIRDASGNIIRVNTGQSITTSSRTDPDGSIVTIWAGYGDTRTTTLKPDGTITVVFAGRTGETFATSTTTVNSDGSTTVARTIAGETSRTTTTRTSADGSTDTTIETYPDGGETVTSTTERVAPGITRTVSLVEDTGFTRTTITSPDRTVRTVVTNRKGQTHYSSTTRPNPDGSTTTTGFFSDGGGDITTTRPDGSSSAVITDNDEIIETIEKTVDADGSVTTTSTDRNGRTNTFSVRAATTSIFGDGSTITVDANGNFVSETRAGGEPAVAADDADAINPKTGPAVNNVLKYLAEAIVIS